MASASINGITRPAFVWTGTEWINIGDGGTYSIDELIGVSLEDILDKDVLIYNSTASIWQNLPIQNFLNSASVNAFNTASTFTTNSINALTTTDIEEGTNLYFTNQRALDATRATINSASAFALSEANAYSDALTTTDIAEGTNLYFTNQRALDATRATINSASAFALSEANAYSDALTTTDIAEGTNLYFTNQRALDATRATINSASAFAVTTASSNMMNRIDLLSTTDIEEGSNLYFTNQRSLDATRTTINSASAFAVTTASSNMMNRIDLLSTTDIEEGSNLYFTNQRALDATRTTINSASANAYLSAQNYTDSGIANLVDSSPDLLNTLNELAAALGDDPNFATTILNTVTTASIANINYTNSQINALTTTDIEEGTNLYFTNQRALDATRATINSASAFAVTTASSNMINRIDLLTTTDIEEGSNLYYTDTRALNINRPVINSASALSLSQANLYTDTEISDLRMFSTIQTSPSTQTILADNNSDTFTFIAGENISIVGASASDAITINSTGNYTSVDSISYPDYLVFDTSPETTSASTSTLSWDSGEGGLAVQLNPNTQVTLGQEIIVLVNNAEATTLNKGEVVYIFSASGQKISVKRASNLSDTTSAKTFGVIAESIASGAEGFVVSQGIVKNINTNSYNEGDILWLGSTSGTVTTTKPQAPLHAVFVGVVIKKNVSSGRIYVKPQNGYELDEIHDVRITSIADGDIIVWNSASSLWLNEYLDTDIVPEGSGSNIYYTRERWLGSASSYLIHENHVNIQVSYNEELDQILIEGAGGGPGGGDAFTSFVTSPATQTVAPEYGTDTITFVSGDDIVITGTATTDRITFASTAPTKAFVWWMGV